MLTLLGDLGDVTETEISDYKCYFLNYSDNHDDDLHNAPPAKININGNYNMNIKINQLILQIMIYLLDFPIVLEEDNYEFDELVAVPSTENNIGNF